MISFIRFPLKKALTNKQRNDLLQKLSIQKEKCTTTNGKVCCSNNNINTQIVHKYINNQNKQINSEKQTNKFKKTKKKDRKTNNRHRKTNKK